eukprot:1139299-Pelagomonas_calceolata.AAC.1
MIHQIQDVFHSARCPLCGKRDSIGYIALTCLYPTMNGMHTNRHRVGLSSCVSALSMSYWLPYWHRCLPDERLREQGIEVPENISRAIPGWVFPCGAGSSARHQSRSDTIFVHSIPGRPAHLDLTKIPPQDRDVHLQVVEFKFCTGTNPFSILEAATAQHASTRMRLKTRSSRNPNSNNKTCSSFHGPSGGDLLGVWGWRAGGQESRRPGAWRATLQILISSVMALECLMPSGIMKGAPDCRRSLL